MDLTKSLALQERAKQFIPGMTQLLSKRPDMFTQGVWPGYYKKAQGTRVWDLDNNKYLDMSISGIGANVLGYADPDVDAAVIEAIRNGSSCSLNSYEEVELAELLCELHPWASMVRFSRTGGESMAIAVRIARATSRKDKVAFCGYHGWHDWYLAANLSTDSLGDHLIPGLDPAGVPKGLTGTAFPFNYNKLEELEAIVKNHGKDLGVIVMESIRSTPPSEEFVKGVRDLANECRAILIIDEISAGFRINTGGAHLMYGIQPDIAVFSKALGNGYPIGAIIGNEYAMDSAQSTFISSTNWTERVGFTAAIAMIKKHQKLEAYKHLIDIGQKAKKGWKELAEKHNIDLSIGGMDPLAHFAFSHPEGLSLKALFIQEMLERNILASNLFYVMHAHSQEDLDQYLKAIDETFPILADAIEKDDIATRLKGLPASAGFKRLT